MYTYHSFETFEEDNVKYYLQFDVGSRHENRFREDWSITSNDIQV